MLVYRDYVTFTVMGSEINLISNETEYGQSTVAEMGDLYYYLGEEYPNVLAAVLAWQEVNGRDLSNEELRQVMVDNNLISNVI